MGCHSGVVSVQRLKCATEKLRVHTFLLLFSIVLVSGKTCIQVPRPEHFSQAWILKQGGFFSRFHQVGTICHR